jgi:hypothetical protein
MASTLDELVRSMPTPKELRDRLPSLAMLDAIFGTRYLTYSYTTSFSDGVALGHRGRYWSRSLDAVDIEPILALQPLSRARAERLNPEVDWAFVQMVAGYGGYPLLP